MNIVTVEEAIHHGDTYKVRRIELDLTDIAAVTDMLNTCSYLRMPSPDFGKGAALVSRSYDEIVAERARDAARIAHELTTHGTAGIGWVEYEIVR